MLDFKDKGKKTVFIYDIRNGEGKFTHFRFKELMVYDDERVRKPTELFWRFQYGKYLVGCFDTERSKSKAEE